MSYQVLARKWRPRTFEEMVGQEHVLKALINGLDNGRLHHAYLFTGTRGVGKTTLARIIAKCLNCEKGVSSKPCGECSACRAIADGRFVDLLEVDAASRTKVEDTREMLDNVQYLPTNGRYKVYLIDEVHMLSTHSFNALLKTLEEPPPHVKFLLATTDPQKLPVTILSRCLQFNLKNLNPERIVNHLQHVLGQENIPFEEEALWSLGRAADGSMRDALSLADQAIAHGGGQVTAAEVNAMLGTLDRHAVVDICESVARGDASDALARVEVLAEHAPDYAEALGDMLSFWHRVAIAQTAPDALDQSHADHHRVLALAAELDREAVQLYYQITLLGRRDLPFAADPRSGFEMVLLRLLAFRPVAGESVPTKPKGTSAGPSSPAAVEAAASAKKSEPVTPAPPVVGGLERSSRQTAAAPSAPDNAPEPVAEDDRPPWEVYEESQNTVPDSREFVSDDRNQPGVAVPASGVLPSAGSDREPNVPHRPISSSIPRESTGRAAEIVAKPDARPRLDDEEPTDLAAPLMPARPQKGKIQPERIGLSGLSPETWHDVYLGLDCSGLLQNIAANLYFLDVEGHQLSFVLDENNSSLFNEGLSQRVEELLSGYFDASVQVVIRVGAVPGETPWQILMRQREERRQAAIQSLRQDTNVRSMMETLGGTLVEESVKPVD